MFNVQRCGAGFWTGYRNQARVTNVFPVAAGSAKIINLEVKGFIGCRFIASRLVRTELITCLWQICLIAKQHQPANRFTFQGVCGFRHMRECAIQ